MEEKIRIGISSCLLGENVRYDGGHQLDRFIRDTLGKFLEYVPVCPEVECGFSIPREPFRLVGSAEAPRLVTSSTNVDCTDRMKSWADKRVAELENEGLCGFIFKSGSPSSGMERVKVYDADGVPSKTGVGIFARAFREHFPLLPVEDDSRLHDAVLRENFIERIFVYRRWREAVATGLKRGTLVEFHTRHKLIILSHSPTAYREMGQLTAHAKEVEPQELRQQYETLLFGALSRKATARKHNDVLMQVMGYFKKNLAADEKEELLDVFDNYRRSYVPLIVPITLLNHYVRKYNQHYLKQHYYLNPEPGELQLRNHV